MTTVNGSPVTDPSPVTLPNGDPVKWSTPLDVSELSLHVAACNRADKNTRAKGDRLEALMCWLFPHLPGITAVRRNVYSEDGSQEIDVIFTYDASQGASLGLSDVLFGECKNWKDPVDSSEIAWMDWKMRLGGAYDGILLAANGITNRHSRKNDAASIIGQCNSETPRRRIIVITMDEISRLTSTEDLKKLLIERMLDIAARKALG